MVRRGPSSALRCARFLQRPLAFTTADLFRTHTQLFATTLPVPPLASNLAPVTWLEWQQFCANSLCLYNGVRPVK